MSNQEQILIIKHGALGDMVLATGPMQAIRSNHPNANIVLLTTEPFVKLMKPAPFLDEVWIDRKPKPWHLRQLSILKGMLNYPRFDWVYDLQTSSRSTRYFKLFVPPRPRFSGLAKGSSHRHNTPERTSLHTIDRQKQQLEIAGINDVPAPNLDWLQDDVSAIRPEGNYTIIVPGGSAHRPEKRWPTEHFIKLCQSLISQNITPLLIGTNAEKTLLNDIEKAVPEAKNLCNQTNFAQLVTLARNAVYAVGNDTGPMHMIAAAGCPCSVIFNINASNPALCAPRGNHVSIVTSDDLATVTPEQILGTMPLANAA